VIESDIASDEMSKKRNEYFNQTQNQDEVTVFLNRVLQWLCDLQSQDIEFFEEQEITELGQAIAKKLGLVVFCDLDRNYRNAHNLRVLVAQKGEIPSMMKEPDYDTVSKVSQFEVRVDISRKGGFFCLRSYPLSPMGKISSNTGVQKSTKDLQKVCDQVVHFLTKNGLIQVPDALLNRHIDGRNELGGEVTVLSQLFGEL
jgi:hypothetical protein